MVTGPGVVEVRRDVITPDTVPPDGYSIVPDSLGKFYDVFSGASWVGNVTLCFTYDESWLTGPEDSLRLFHYHDSSWGDVTVDGSPDTDQNTLCGRTATLSPFIIAEPYCCELRGDVTGDGLVKVADITFLIAYVWRGGPPPNCSLHADVTGDDPTYVNVADVTFLIAYVFRGGPPPVACP